MPSLSWHDPMHRTARGPVSPARAGGGAGSIKSQSRSLWLADRAVLARDPSSGPTGIGGDRAHRPAGDRRSARSGVGTRSRSLNLNRPWAVVSPHADGPHRAIAPGNLAFPMGTFRTRLV